jgi:hypothetical protein
VTEAIKHAAQEIDALPSDRREFGWHLVYFVVLFSFCNAMLEYALWIPFWSHVVLPLWGRLL